MGRGGAHGARHGDDELRQHLHVRARVEEPVSQDRDQASIWVDWRDRTAVGLFYGAWLDRYAEFMMVLGGLLVPVGGVLFAHFRLSRAPVHVPDLYDGAGRIAACLHLVSPPGPRRARVLPASPWGGTLPALATAIARTSSSAAAEQKGPGPISIPLPETTIGKVSRSGTSRDGTDHRIFACGWLCGRRR